MNDEMSRIIVRIVLENIDWESVVEENIDIHYIKECVVSELEPHDFDLDCHIDERFEEIIDNGCSTTDDICHTAVMRSMDSQYYGNDFVILSPEEYNRLITVADFVESTFNIPEPVDNTAGAISKRLCENAYNAQIASSVLDQWKLDTTKKLNQMSKPELIAWAVMNGYNVDLGWTMTEIREKVGL